jgi:hypothetical protein
VSAPPDHTLSYVASDKLVGIVDIQGDHASMPFGFGVPELIIVLAVLLVIGFAVRAVLR